MRLRDCASQLPDCSNTVRQGPPRIKIKTLCVVLAAVFFWAGCYTTGSQSSKTPESNPAPDSKKAQTFVWTKLGLSLAFTEGCLTILGPGHNLRIEVWESLYRGRNERFL